MLVLTRAVGQSVLIEGVGVVKVIGIRKGQVQIGIDAPREIPIRREELPPLDSPECLQQSYSGPGETAAEP